MDTHAAQAHLTEALCLVSHMGGTIKLMSAKGAFEMDHPVVLEWEMLAQTLVGLAKALQEETKTGV